jgi:hypothetical protein
VGVAEEQDPKGFLDKEAEIHLNSLFVSPDESN